MCMGSPQVLGVLLYELLRLAGFLALGPWMACVGTWLEGLVAQRDEEQAAYASQGKAGKKRMLDEYRRSLLDAQLQRLVARAGW